jgi:hypothetical protein
VNFKSHEKGFATEKLEFSSSEKPYQPFIFLFLAIASKSHLVLERLRAI